MACCLLSAKPLSEPMKACGRLDLWKQFSVKFETIFLQYNEFEYVTCKMAATLSRPQCVFVFVFDGLYLYLYLYLIRFSPVYLYLYLYLKLREQMYLYLYLYLIKRIWPQPWRSGMGMIPSELVTFNNTAQSADHTCIFFVLFVW